MSTERQIKTFIGISLTEEEFLKLAEKNYGIEYVDQNKKYCADLLETFSEDVFDFEIESIYDEKHKKSYKFGIPIKTNVSYTESINEINNAGIQFATAFDKKFGEEIEPELICEIFTF